MDELEIKQMFCYCTDQFASNKNTCNIYRPLKIMMRLITWLRKCKYTSNYFQHSTRFTEVCLDLLHQIPTHLDPTVVISRTCDTSGPVVWREWADVVTLWCEHETRWWMTFGERHELWAAAPDGGGCYTVQNEPDISAYAMFTYVYVYFVYYTQQLFYCKKGFSFTWRSIPPPTTRWRQRA